MASGAQLSFVEGRFACNPTAVPHTQKNSRLSNVMGELDAIADGTDTSIVRRDTWTHHEIKYVDTKLEEYRNTTRGELKETYEQSKSLFSSMETRLGPFVAHSHTRIILQIASVFVFFIPAVVGISLLVYIVLGVARAAPNLIYMDNWLSTWKGIMKCFLFLIVLWFIKGHLQLR